MADRAGAQQRLEVGVGRDRIEILLHPAGIGRAGKFLVGRQRRDAQVLVERDRVREFVLELVADAALLLGEVVIGRVEQDRPLGAGVG